MVLLFGTSHAIVGGVQSGIDGSHDGAENGSEEAQVQRPTTATSSVFEALPTK